MMQHEQLVPWYFMLKMVPKECFRMMLERLWDNSTTHFKRRKDRYILIMDKMDMQWKSVTNFMAIHRDISLNKNLE